MQRDADYRCRTGNNTEHQELRQPAGVISSPDNAGSNSVGASGCCHILVEKPVEIGPQSPEGHPQRHRQGTVRGEDLRVPLALRSRVEVELEIGTGGSACSAASRSAASLASRSARSRAVFSASATRVSSAFATILRDGIFVALRPEVLLNFGHPVS